MRAAGLLGAEERIEQALLDFGANAFATVAQFKNHGAGFAPGYRSACRARAKRDGSRAINGFSAVANEIDQHLLQVTAISPDVQLRAGFTHRDCNAQRRIW